MPVMGGSVLIVGTIGHRTCYLWDRCVIGIAEDGSVMGYEVMNAANYVIRVADNICELLVKGPNQHYLETMRKIVLDENITEATVRRISKRLARARGLHMDSDTELTPGDVMRVHGARLKIGTGKDNDCPITDTEVMESSSILFCG
ncbi:GP26 [Caviid betaherpesvirus 2]|nr:GP26 [Caviid betaherpesvirus 2]AGE11502.1 GP26 [Caviid betaherpesvirus 2]AIL83890.1 GP26 [BAC cloning vector GPN13BACdenovo_preserved(MM)]BAJ78492.1 GP26 [Caviid betaherpesvirus 2]